MERSPRKRVCLLTGAGGAFGSAFCQQLASDYDIVAVHRGAPPQVPTQDQSRIDPLDPRKPLVVNTHRVFAVQADLEDDREIDRVVELALARYERIDLLVNAAVSYSFGPLLGSRRLLDSLEQQFRVNSILPVKMAVTVAERFWQVHDQDNLSENRNVVNLSSTASFTVRADTGGAGYSTSKVALNYLSRFMAQEFKRVGVRVNALAPAAFPTAEVPMRAVLDGVRQLDSGAMTGRILVLDGQGPQLR